jgi:hypothetical protein
VARSATPPTPHSTHIFAVAGTLRVPLSQPQKRHIQPERYAKCHQNILKKRLTKHKNQCKILMNQLKEFSMFKYFIVFSFVLIFASCSTNKTVQYNEPISDNKQEPSLYGIWIQNSTSPLAWNFCFNEDLTFFIFYGNVEKPIPAADIKGETPIDAKEIIGDAMPLFLMDNPLITSGTFSFSLGEVRLNSPKMENGIWQQEESSADWKYMFMTDLSSGINLVLTPPNGKRIILHKEEGKLPFETHKIALEKDLLGISIAQAEELFAKKFIKINDDTYKIPLYYPNFADEIQLKIDKNNIIISCINFFPGSQKTFDKLYKELIETYNVHDIKDNTVIFVQNLPNNVNEILLGFVDKGYIAIIYR